MFLRGFGQKCFSASLEYLRGKSSLDFLCSLIHKGGFSKRKNPWNTWFIGDEIFFSLLSWNDNISRHLTSSKLRSIWCFCYIYLLRLLNISYGVMCHCRVPWSIQCVFMCVTLSMRTTVLSILDFFKKREKSMQPFHFSTLFKHSSALIKITNTQKF